mmetsp:Transcript_68021/g.142042  ORF Transcript_68021/g.142042 Transcript_68021/m.142042 type:complete len:273 (+) Transcript_68021:345-1163(+)
MHVLKNLPFLSTKSLAALFVLLLGLVLRGAIVKQLWVSLHQQLQNVEGEPVHRTVPVLLGVLVQRTNDDREQILAILVDQLDNVVIVPEEESALGNLEVRTRDAKSQPAEENFLHTVELGWLRQLQSLFELVQEQDLFRRDGEGPVPEHGCDDFVGQAWILLDVLSHAVGQLLIEGYQRFDLVQGDESLDQEVLVFILQRQREAIDDTSKDFKQLANTVVSLALVDDFEEHVLDSSADEGAEGHELAVDAMQNRLQIVPLTRILGVEELQQL